MVTTRSAYVKSPWQFRLREVDLPAVPEQGWALVKIEACGICGADLIAAAQDATEWQAFGHEIAGVVEEIGPGCEDLNIGEKVVLQTSNFCSRCELCRNGRVDLCNKAPSFWGKEPMGFSDYILAPAGCIVPYEGISPEIASLAEPGGVAYDMVKVADIGLGDSVCVVGPGPIGLMALVLAQHRGAANVLVIDKLPSKRLDIAGRLGADTRMIETTIKDHGDLHRQFNRVLLTAPPQIIPEALELLTTEGRLTYVGLGDGKSTVSFNPDDFHLRKLQLCASYPSPGIYFPYVLKFLRLGVIPGDMIISHSFSLQDIEKAMITCRDDRESVVKAIVKPNME